MVLIFNVDLLQHISTINLVSTRFVCMQALSDLFVTQNKFLVTGLKTKYMYT